MEKPNVIPLFSPEQLAAIEEMIAKRSLSPVQRQQVNELLAKPHPHDFTLFSGSSHPEFSKKISNLLGKGLCKKEIDTFSCGEKKVNLLETVRNSIVFLLQTCRDQEVDSDLMELFIMSNTAKHAYSKKRVAVIPYLGYTRQDKIHGKREPITAKLMARLIEESEIDHVITCQLHADQEQGFFSVPVDHIKPYELFANFFNNELSGIDPKNIVVVSTDAGGVKNAKEFANAMGEVGIAIVHKERHEDNKSEVTHIEGDVKGKICVLVDDMVDTGGSVCNGKEALIAAGANPDVYLCATHAIFSGKAIERLKKAKFKKVVVSDTLPLSEEKQFEGLTQLSVAPLFVEKMAKHVGIRKDKDTYENQNGFIEGDGI